MLFFLTLGKKSDDKTYNTTGSVQYHAYDACMTLSFSLETFRALISWPLLSAHRPIGDPGRSISCAWALVPTGHRKSLRRLTIRVVDGEYLFRGGRGRRPIGLSVVWETVSKCLPSPLRSCLSKGSVKYLIPENKSLQSTYL